MWGCEETTLKERENAKTHHHANQNRRLSQSFRATGVNPCPARQCKARLISRTTTPCTTKQCIQSYCRTCRGRTWSRSEGSQSRPNGAKVRPRDCSRSANFTLPRLPLWVLHEHEFKKKDKEIQILFLPRQGHKKKAGLHTVPWTVSPPCLRWSHALNSVASVCCWNLLTSCSARLMRRSELLQRSSLCSTWHLYTSSIRLRPQNGYTDIVLWDCLRNYPSVHQAPGRKQFNIICSQKTTLRHRMQGLLPDAPLFWNICLRASASDIIIPSLAVNTLGMFCKRNPAEKLGTSTRKSLAMFRITWDKPSLTCMGCIMDTMHLPEEGHVLPCVVLTTWSPASLQRAQPGLEVNGPTLLNKHYHVWHSWLHLLQLISSQACEGEPGQIILKVLAKFGKRPVHWPPQWYKLAGHFIRKTERALHKFVTQTTEIKTVLTRWPVNVLRWFNGRSALPGVTSSAYQTRFHSAGNCCIVDAIRLANHADVWMRWSRRQIGCTNHASMFDPSSKDRVIFCISWPKKVDTLTSFSRFLFTAQRLNPASSTEGSSLMFFRTLAKAALLTYEPPPKFERLTDEDEAVMSTPSHFLHVSCVLWP